MLEYVFFDSTVMQAFIVKARQLGIEAHQSATQPLLVELPEDIDEPHGEIIDHEYERLLQVSAEMMELRGEGLEKDVAAVQVALSDGSPCTIRLDPELLSRLLSAVTMEEIRDLLQMVAEGVERRDNRPLCHN